MECQQGFERCSFVGFVAKHQWKTTERQDDLSPFFVLIHGQIFPTGLSIVQVGYDFLLPGPCCHTSFYGRP